MLDLLLFSNSTNANSGYLDHARDEVAQFLDAVNEVIFVPYALQDHDAYTAKVAKALAAHSIITRGLHTFGSPQDALAKADAVFVGGGNTFRLVSQLHRQGLMDPLREAAQSGTRYMGASAGTNIASPTLRTTNDMPIVEPPSFSTLGLVPFQINPHYLDADPGSTHAGETRETRLSEFLEENDVPVLGLREGAHLRVTGTAGEPNLTAMVGGTAVTPGLGPAITFRKGTLPRETTGDVSALFEAPTLFDTP
ncbi:dipeptidase PepE [Arthrobacter sp. MI7-26]|uniref:dipeptidase PepE n=1 Tax=Arthrobacter sp. MI7-26 TaxID=2993653 RepID=UPI002248CD1F|nr:dipeptidase PepE [Arthrobacter sp. MI7-26]MCX2747861.1 dipeptidase PepE [Arthrobacter sp. MI7-26]